ncbi:MAG: putative exosome complex component RRP45, partial [Streblomastix strix]
RAAIFDSQSISTRALCILGGVYVWILQIDITVLDDCGSVADACITAAFTALLHFRRPKTMIVGEKLIIQPMNSIGDGLPISLLHIPVSTSYAIYHHTSAVLLDPTNEEEKECEGFVSVLCNSRG